MPQVPKVTLEVMTDQCSYYGRSILYAQISETAQCQ